MPINEGVRKVAKRPIQTNLTSTKKDTVISDLEPSKEHSTPSHLSLPIYGLEKVFGSCTYGSGVKGEDGMEYFEVAWRNR